MGAVDDAHEVQFDKSMPFFGGGIEKHLLVEWPPALVMQMSTPPNFSATWATNCCTAEASVTSRGSARTSALWRLRISSAAIASFLAVARTHGKHLSAFLANFSAEALGMPSLDVQTITLRFWRPRSMSSTFTGAGSRVGIVAVDPILARRIEDVEVHGVFESEGFVRNVGRDAEDLAGVDGDFVAFESKLQCAFEDVGDLFVVRADATGRVRAF